MMRLAIMTPAAESRPLLKGVLWIVAVAVVLNYPYRAAKAFEENQGIDFKRHNYFYAQIFRDGQDPYDLNTVERYRQSSGITPLCVAGYPPPFLMALAPFTWLPVGRAVFGWLVFEHLCLAAALYLIWRVRPRGLPGAAAAALVLLAAAFNPLLYDVRSAQSAMFSLLLITTAAAAWRQGRAPWAGAALAVAMLVKIELVFLLPFVLWRRGWAVISWAVGILAVVVGLSVYLAEPGAWAGYWGYLSTFLRGEPMTLYRTGTLEVVPTVIMGSAQFDISLSAWLSRLVIPSDFSRPILDAPSLLPFLRWSAAAAVGIVFLWRTWGPSRPAELALIDIALGVVAILLASPKNLFYSYTYLLFPLALLLWDAARDRPAAGRWGLAVCYLLLFQNTTAIRVGLGQALGRTPLLSLVPPLEVVGLVVLFVLLLRVRGAELADLLRPKIVAERDEK